nr:MAG: major capsid protein [Microviridae sp.]WNN13357.1 MAG: major capsid protein [Microviridae sp.]
MARGHSLQNVPIPRFPRARFNLSHSVTTSMDVGTLYPIDWQEVVPGDVFKCRAFDVSRVTSSFLKPVMDNLFLDVYHFFVPHRLVFDNFEKVFGNPNPSAYTDNALEEIPMTYGEVKSGSVGDYLGLPLGTISQNNPVSVLPFRSFALIYDKYFRNENTTDEIYIQKKGFSLSELLGENSFAPNSYCGKLPKVNKYKDYFTSCVPNPQKGAPVTFNLGERADVRTADKQLLTSGLNPLMLKTVPNGVAYANTALLSVDSSLGGVRPVVSPTVTQNAPSYLAPVNLYADLSSANSISVDDLRLAFAYQKMLERDAIYGSRYNEYLYGHFGVHIPDAYIQFPQYLGGGRTPLNIVQVAQTSQGTEESPLGNVGAYSWTNGRTGYSRKFKEHGLVMTVACLRYRHTYQQGISKKWRRKVREDFYDPLFSTIGQQPVYTTELYANTPNNTVFGYREAWSELRSIPNTISGEMRSSATNSLDIWHFADNYSSVPTLSQSFTEETPAYVDRTLSVPSSSQDNFILNFYFDMSAVRKMPVYSLPSLIDHH